MILLEKEQEQYWKLMNRLNEATTLEVSVLVLLKNKLLSV